MILYFILVAVYNLFFHPLSRYPGPWWFAVSRLPYTIEIFRGTVTWTVKDMHMKYGHVVRIAPDTLSFTTSEAWQGESLFSSFFFFFSLFGFFVYFLLHLILRQVSEHLTFN